MTNKEVATIINTLGKIMELHGENPFKIRSYSSAYVTIRKLPEPVIDMEREELLGIKGIGKAIADKIVELRETGELSTLNRYLEKTPPGIVEMLSIKGFGPKKIKTVWEGMQIESPGELLYACEENRLIELKGFGAKTQETIKQQLIYFLDSRGKYLYGHILAESERLLGLLREQFGAYRFEFIHGLRRQLPIVDGIEILTDGPAEEIMSYCQSLEGVEEIDGAWHYAGSKIVIVSCATEEYDSVWWQGSASEEFVAAWSERYPDQMRESAFEDIGLQPIPAECRERVEAIDMAPTGLSIISEADIRGVVHTHSTHSDGVNTIREMAEESQRLGYEYLVMSDHSKAAFYANGLNEDRVLAQMEEIDRINAEMKDFHIFKSIECDILYDGSLDYDDDFLKNFDLVIASVHSNLKMDQDKAMHRLLTAVAHPATRILGHPTGRLLLSREGYPIDHMALIDACAEHDVVIELNASPYRLDLDWTWIPYAVERGVMISINPDAHSIAGIQDIQYGVSAARKALLAPAECLNAKGLSDFKAWLGQ